jgi:hypothetical protein
MRRRLELWATFKTAEPHGGNTSKNGSSNLHFQRPFQHEYHLGYISVSNIPGASYRREKLGREEGVCIYNACRGITRCDRHFG